MQAGVARWSTSFTAIIRNNYTAISRDIALPVKFGQGRKALRLDGSGYPHQNNRLPMNAHNRMRPMISK